MSAEAITVLHGMSLGAMCGTGKHRGAQPASPSCSQHKSEAGITRGTQEGQSCSHSVPAASVLQRIICQYILRSIRSLFTRDICFRIAKVSVAFSKTDQVSSTEIIKKPPKNQNQTNQPTNQNNNNKNQPQNKPWSQRTQCW